MMSQEYYLARLSNMISYVATSSEWGALLTELIVFTSMWAVAFRIMCKGWTSHFSKKPFWAKLKTRRGFSCPNHQLELVMLSSICPHHFIGGIFMFCGYITSSPTLIRHGIIWEAGFNLYDYIAMAFGLFPWHGEVLKSGALLNIVHHFGALCFGLFVIKSGLVFHEEIAVIGFSLEGAAAINLGTLAYQYTLDFRKQMGAAWLTQSLNLVMFVIFRYWFFTRASWAVAYGLIMETDGFQGYSMGVKSGAILTMFLFQIFNIYVSVAGVKRHLKLSQLLVDEWITYEPLRKILQRVIDIARLIIVPYLPESRVPGTRKSSCDEAGPPCVPNSEKLTKRAMSGRKLKSQTKKKDMTNTLLDEDSAS